MRALIIVLALIGAGAAAGLWVTRPATVDANEFAGLTADLEHGALVFAAMGCASCHASGDDPTLLGGGARFASDFGTLVAPNISSDPTHGIGGWTDLQVISAMRFGTGAQGEHLYPALPYTSYVHATDQDLLDVTAYLRSLPAVATPSADNELAFPFNIRASLGGWKLLFAGQGWVVTDDLTEAEARGRYLVEGLAHCGECHTPRNALGAVDRSQWLKGAPNPSGDGTIPDISAAALDWSDGDVVSYLQSGFTPDFDTAGGSMVKVIDNLAKLPVSDVEAIVAYLRKVP